MLPVTAHARVKIENERFEHTRDTTDQKRKEGTKMRDHHHQVFCRVGVMGICKTWAVDCDLERDTVGGLKAKILMGTIGADKRLVSEH